MDSMAVAGFGAAAAVHLGFAAYFAWSGRARAERGPAVNLFVAALVASGLWALAELGSLLSADRVWPNAAALLDLLRYALWLVFLLRLAAPRADGQASPRLRGALHASAWAALGIVGAYQLGRIVGQTIEEPPGRVLMCALLSLPVLGMLLIEQLFRGASEDTRWHAKPLCVGLAIVFVFDVYMISEGLLFSRLDPVTQGARGLVHLLAVPVLLIGARHRTKWLQRVQVSRSAAFHSATLVLAGGYLLVMSAIGYYVRWFGGEWGRGLQLALLFGAIAFGVAVMASGTLRARVRVFLGKHFFRYRFDYREEWLRFTATLASSGTPQDVSLRVIQGLANLVECPAGSLWTRTDADGPFRQAERWNMALVDAQEPSDSPFSRFLAEKAWVVDLDEFRSAPRRYEDFALPTWLLGAREPWLIVPLITGSTLLGFVVLARPRARIEVNWEVLDLLKTASRQAAGQLAQMQATEALLEARKFDAFNRMSAFVVHDLKNIVTQLSLMLKNAERLRDNREFQQDMLLTVESSLEKMRRLMLQLREGAAPPGSSHGVELAPIVQRLEASAKAQGRTLEVSRLERLSTRGHDERLERVLGHLVQNAFDATPKSGRVWLAVERASGQVRIEVGDTGAGMSEEFVRTRLFKPFSSTKGSGMGVGAFESSQYIRELGGTIGVDSAPGRGTVIDVRLPLFEQQQGSDLLRDAA